MNQMFFIIGLRRSGTSITQELVSKSPGVSRIDFEPHDLWNAVDLKHFPRIMSDPINREWVERVIKRYHYRPGVHGAKFALNPGVKALEWKWLYKEFPEAKFIFLHRNPEHTRDSYIKADCNSFRGVIGKDSYMTLAGDMIMEFAQFSVDNKAKAIRIKYEKILSDPDREIGRVFDFLGVEKIKNLMQYIRDPENK